MPIATLKRQTFSTSRELEYFSEQELTTQTGYGREDWWPGVIVKELIDNSLDACEQAGTAPCISIDFQGTTLTVADNGPGIRPDVVERILDFSSRTSDKAAYVSPTRGAQGNAFKTILAIPYVLSKGKASCVEIDCGDIRHTITVSTDHVLQRPQVEHRQEEIVRNSGTVIRVTLDLARSEMAEEEPEFLQNLIADFALFNPHATFDLQMYKERSITPATNPELTKWLPTDPTSAHWYSQERLETLIGSYIGSERDGRSRSVREFVSEFRGLSSTAKQKQVAEATGLQRAFLHDLVSNGHFDHDAVSRLLAAMREMSVPVKPEMLGILGREHFECRLQPEGESFRYICKKEIDQHGLPYLIECAFAVTPKHGLRGFRAGMNWSAPLGNPFQSDTFRIDNEHAVAGLWALLSNQRVSLHFDPVCLAIHVTCPRFRYLDRGKGSVSLGQSSGESIRSLLAEGVLAVIKDWAAIKKKEDRDRRQSESKRDKYLRGQSARVSVKDAAYTVMAAAYEKASGSGRYPANARQIMYAARPAMQEYTEQLLGDVYFTQTLLPDYIRDHPSETAGWDVVYDARGHLWEPHTGKQIGIGTLEVRTYLRDSVAPLDLGIEAPRLEEAFPTSGSLNRYNAVLYVEKEGFLPLLQRARFAERYDLAIMSSKGMGTVAARALIEELSKNATIFVLHDFDKAGFSIAGTLTRDTRRYEFATSVQVIDLGIRLKDVERWQLQSEKVELRSDPTDNLIENGATEEEIDFLRLGKRVELNAFTSDQFVEWLDSKLAGHGAKKVIPNEEVLEQAYRRAAAVRRYQTIIADAHEEVSRFAKELRVPTDLRSTLLNGLARTPDLSWDELLLDLARDQGTRSREELDQERS